jgi:hypothetical protein
VSGLVSVFGLHAAVILSRCSTLDMGNLIGAANSVSLPGGPPASLSPRGLPVRLGAAWWICTAAGTRPD